MEDFAKKVLPDQGNVYLINSRTLYSFMTKRPDQELMISLIMFNYSACENKLKLLKSYFTML